MNYFKPWQLLVTVAIITLCTGASVLAIAGLVHLAR